MHEMSSSWKGLPFIDLCTVGSVVELCQEK